MKKNIVFLLILIPIIWISCDGMGHQTIDFRKIENLMPQHPDSALMLLEQIENKEDGNQLKGFLKEWRSDGTLVLVPKVAIWSDRLNHVMEIGIGKARQPTGNKAPT